MCSLFIPTPRHRALLIKDEAMNVVYLDAKELAAGYLTTIEMQPGDVSYVLMESLVKEGVDGWYFPYQSKSYNGDGVLINHWLEIGPSLLIVREGIWGHAANYLQSKNLELKKIIVDFLICRIDLRRGLICNFLRI